MTPSARRVLVAAILVGTSMATGPAHAQDGDEEVQIVFRITDRRLDDFVSQGPNAVDNLGFTGPGLGAQNWFRSAKRLDRVFFLGSHGAPSYLFVNTSTEDVLTALAASNGVRRSSVGFLMACNGGLSEVGSSGYFAPSVAAQAADIWGKPVIGALGEISSTDLTVAGRRGLHEFAMSIPGERGTGYGARTVLLSREQVMRLFRTRPGQKIDYLPVGASEKLMIQDGAYLGATTTRAGSSLLREASATGTLASSAMKAQLAFGLLGELNHAAGGGPASVTLAGLGGNPGPVLEDLAILTEADGARVRWFEMRSRYVAKYMKGPEDYATARYLKILMTEDEFVAKYGPEPPLANTVYEGVRRKRAANFRSFLRKAVRFLGLD